MENGRFKQRSCVKYGMQEKNMGLDEEKCGCELQKCQNKQLMDQNSTLWQAYKTHQNTMEHIFENHCFFDAWVIDIFQ